MTIARRLILLLALPLAALLGLGVFIRIHFSEIEERSRFVAQAKIPSLAALGNISRSFSEMRVNVPGADKWETTIPNQLSPLMRAIEALDCSLEQWGASADARCLAQLAVEELGTNIIKYGYDDQEEHFIRLSAPRRMCSEFAWRMMATSSIRV